MQDEGRAMIPIDIVTDCYDLYQVTTGLKGIPVDKTQRLTIFSLREDRLSGRIRMIYHWPTEIMIMDALTKQGTFPQMQDYLQSGHIRYQGLLKAKNGVTSSACARSRRG
eukprot:7281570-Pyramimonas_sp.AAC.1